MVFDKIKTLSLLTDPLVRKVLAQFTALKTEDQKLLLEYLGKLAEFINLLKRKGKIKEFLKTLVNTALEIGPQKRKILLKSGFAQDIDIDNRTLKILQEILK